MIDGWVNLRLIQNSAGLALTVNRNMTVYWNRKSEQEQDIANVFLETANKIADDEVFNLW